VGLGSFGRGSDDAGGHGWSGGRGELRGWLRIVVERDVDVVRRDDRAGRPRD
jgi:hypothetical protein